jgi:hypothetical protein
MYTILSTLALLVWNPYRSDELSIDSYKQYAASALSAALFGRNDFGAFFPLASPDLYHHWDSIEHQSRWIGA